MGFGSQLRLLLWKNFTLRKRQPVRLVIELLWPLALFLILVLVKTRQLNEARHECHYEGKAMPSAGVLPLLQGIVCGWNNTCSRTTTTDEISGQVQTFNNSLLSKLLEDVEMILSNRTDMNDIIDLIEDFEILNTFATNIQSGNIVGGIKVSNFLIDPQQLREEVANQNIALQPQIVSDILNANVNIQQLLRQSRLPLPQTDILSNLSNLAVNPQQALQDILDGNINPLQVLQTLITRNLPQIAQGIQSGSLNTQQLLMQGLVDQSLLTNLTWAAFAAKSFVCNETALSSVLIMNDPGLVSEQLCNLTQSNLTALVSDIRQDFNATAVLREARIFLANNTGSSLNIIENAGKLRETVMRIFTDVSQLKSLQSIGADVNRTFQDVRGIAMESAAGNISNGSGNMGLLAQLFCGSATAFPIPGGANESPGNTISTANDTANDTANNTAYQDAKQKTLLCGFTHSYGGTGDSAPCVFPFIYKGVSYTGCTQVDASSHGGQKWCATTDNYDRDRKWGQCPDIPTTGGNGRNANCVFPFIYKGQTYTNCTAVDNKGTGFKWCSTTGDYDRDQLWGKCTMTTKSDYQTAQKATDQCGQGLYTYDGKSGNATGQQCVFPFTYKGKNYTSCTMVDDNHKWCSVVSNYDTDPQRRWGFCPDYCNDELFAVFKTNQFTKALWQQLEPMVTGKILFTPDTPLTNKLMDRANMFFSDLGRIRNVAQDWLAYSPTLKNYLSTSSNIQLLRDILNTTSREQLARLPVLSIAVSQLNITDAMWEQWKNSSTRAYFLRYLDSSDYDANGLPRYNWKDSLNYTDVMMRAILKASQCFEFEKFEGHPNETEIIKRSHELIETNQFWAAIVIDNVDNETTVLPTHVNYRLRLNREKTDNTRQIMDKYWRPGPRASPLPDLKYLVFGFSYIQDLLESAIIEEHTSSEDRIGVFVQQFPYPCYIYDKFTMAISRSMPLFMVLAWIYTVAMVVKGVVHEKERRLKEVMKIMGLGNGIHWLAWFINSLVMMTITVILLVITLHFGRVLEHSDPIVLFVFLMAFTVATISQCFLFSVFFSKANLAAACGGFLYFVLYLPYTLIIQWEEYMSTGDKAASALLSTVAFGLGCGYFAKYEEQAVGIQWSNIASSPQPDDGFSMAFCIFMMLVDAVIYWILTWYIEAVFPGEYGIPRPWYFPVTRSYWCGFQQKETNTEEGFNGHVGRVTGNYTVSHNYEMQGRQEDSADIESEPTNLPLGVGLRNLRKVYRRGQKVAVDGLTLNFYEGQITSFLGHNGAGKTTTMSVLTGLFPPTEGTAVVYGKDIRTDMDTIRNSLGVCPQYNVLFDGLTVEEHMWFYARLKGMSEAEVKQEMEGMIKDVGLPHKRDELSKNLSGGMKRKLSVAIAFVGGSKTVILDEPTAGVDPYARRAIWDLLVKYRKGRTIILSTHHMDEADILGDRIAIISLGKLRCCGSSLFLKNKYGSGYYLTMVKANSDEKPADRPVTALSNRTVSDIKAQFVSEKDEGVADMSDTGSKSEHSDSDQSATPPPEYEDPVPCVKDSSDVAVFVQKFIPSAKLVEDMGTELCFQLPEEGAHTGAFEALFRALESNLTKLGITSYGISDTTLEEVFLKVAEESGVDDVNEEQTRNALERYTEGGKIARPVTRLSFRKKKLDFFKKSKPVLNISDTNELVDSDFEDADSVASMPVSEVSTAQGGAGSHKVTGLAHTKDQFLALFVKRFHHVRRSYKGFVCEILLPAIFVCIAMIFTKIIPVIKENPALELQPWMYVPITGTNPHLTVFYTNDAPGSMLADSLERQIRSPLGIGTRCMNSSVYSIRGYPCTPASSAERWTPSPAVTGNTSLDSPSCSCDTGYQTCPPGAGGPLGSSRVMDNTDRLVNMTGRNVSDWLVKTMEDYKKRRYGGYSLGERNQLVQLNSSQLYQVVDRLSRAVNNGQSVLNGNESIWSDIDALIKNVAVQNNVKVWFNNKGWAAMASYMNAMNNVILRSKLPPGKDPAQYGITVSNHPMAPTNKQIERDTLNSAWISVLVAIGVIFAMSFIPASFVLYLIEERVSNSKHLQFVSGVNRVTYWVSHLAWDIMNYSVSMVLCILLFLAFNERSYVSPTNAPCLVLLLFLYGWAMIPMMFPFNYLFKVPSTAFVALACVNVFLGVTSTLSTYVLEFFSDDQELVQINTVLRQVFLILPHYCLGRGLIDMAANQLIADVAGIYVAGTAVKDPFEWDQVGRNLFALAVSGAAWFGFTLLIEYKFFCTSRLSSNENAVDDNEDIDVARERRRAMSAEARSDILRVENLTKVFHKRRKGKFVAVDRLCFSVPKGECFGLLGVNGAGKTTTFKMLTGDETVTKGNAHLAGHSILSEMPSVHQNLGYCPQFDALDMLVTGREHLEFYARLRGVPSSEVKQVAQYCIKKLGLIRYADKPAGEYSGGNRRKLSTAIALIGNPPVIFLDEPTTGMDPKARRFLWNCITSILKDGRSVILTSHSMEECEALCGRIGIMVNGRFRCMGSVQHLKNRFGDGYTVILRVKGHSPDLQPVMNYIQQTFPNVMLKEKHHNMLQYQLPSQGLLLSYLFGKLESVRQELDIEDYSVNQTTLDQVFINFAKLQVDAQDVPEDAEDAMETCKEVNTAPSSMTEQFTVSGSACDLDLIHQSQLYSQVGDFYDDVSITGSTAELIRIDSRRSSMRSTMTPVEDV